MRRLRRLLILVAALVVVLAVADRIALRAAQNEAQRQVVARATWTGGTTTVTIHGFPFLTQVATGNYHDIEVTAQGVSLQGIDGIDADVHLHGVHLPLSSLLQSGTPKVPIDAVEGQATIPYSQLEQRAVALGGADGIKSLTLNKDGSMVRVDAVITIPIIAIPLNASASASLSIDGSQATLVASSVQVAGTTVPASVTSAVLSSINKALASSFVVPTLPYGLRITSIQAGDDGVIAQASATGVIV